MTAEGRTGGDVGADDRTRVDLHVKRLDETVVARAKRRGLDALVYAPHFAALPTIEQRAARFTDDELTVVPARELFTGSWRDRKHVLALGLDAPVPDFLPLDAAMAELERQGATVLVVHPAFLTVSLSAAEVERYREQLAAIEVYNPKHLARHNDRARRIADAQGLPVFGSSYAHLRATVGEVWTSFAGDVADEADLLGALEASVPRRVERRDGPVHRRRCLAERAHLGWENTVEKVDRVLLSGREATHPSQPVYEGRFDDESVY